MVTPADVFAALQRLEAKMDYIIWLAEQRSGGRPVNAYRTELVRQVDEKRKRGASVARACRETGIREETYRKWVKAMALPPTLKPSQPDS